MATAKKTETIEIKPIKLERIRIRIKGDSPLIMHAWSEKAKKEMLDKQMKVTTTTAKSAKNPVEDFIRSMYWLSPMPEEMTKYAYEKAIEAGARFGFPVTAIKQAAMATAYRMGWIDNQMALRGSFFIEGATSEMAEIVSDKPEMREDMVKVGMGTADLRYRGQFNNWYSDLTIIFNANGKYTKEQIVNFINAAGFCCGIGEWRPERDGQFGMFHVE